MRWVSVRTEGRSERAGLVVGDEIRIVDDGRGLTELVQAGGEALKEAGSRARSAPAEVVPFEGADVGAPVQPRQIRDFLAFLDHLRNARSGLGQGIEKEWEEIPAFYFSNTTAVVGPNDPVPISPGCTMFDYELEVAAIIGTEGADLHPDTAAEHIVGFTIFGDWSARDLQMHEMKLGLGPAKGKDGANTLGPMLVTCDELEDFRQGNSYHLEMNGYVGDELVSHGWMDQMDWSWGEIVAYASRGTRILPGEAICSGTVPTGCLLERFALGGPAEFRGWLQPGDVVRLDVAELGATRQEILPAPPVHRLRSGF